MTEQSQPNNLSQLVNQLHGDDLPRSNVPWEHRDVYGSFGGFWRTVFYVIRRNGRLGAEVDAYVEFKAARRFRHLVMLTALLGLAGMAMVLSAPYSLGLAPDLGDEDTRLFFIAGASAGFVILSELAILLCCQVAHWFFMPKAFNELQRHNSLALSYYLSAPVVLLLLGTPAFVLFTTAAENPWLPILVAILPVAVAVYWFQLVLCGLKHITGRRGRKLVMPAILIALGWISAIGGLLLLPAMLLMWLVMWVSLA